MIRIRTLPSSAPRAISRYVRWFDAEDPFPTFYRGDPAQDLALPLASQKFQSSPWAIIRECCRRRMVVVRWWGRTRWCRMTRYRTPNHDMLSPTPAKGLRTQNTVDQRTAHLLLQSPDWRNADCHTKFQASVLQPATLPCQSLPPWCSCPCREADFPVSDRDGRCWTDDSNQPRERSAGNNEGLRLRVISLAWRGNRIARLPERIPWWGTYGSGKEDQWCDRSSPSRKDLQLPGCLPHVV